MPPPQSILVIDDDPDIGELVAASAAARGIHCFATTDPTLFIEALTPHTSLIILDLQMPYIDGIELLRLLGEQKCKAAFVLMSGMDRRIIEVAEQLAEMLGLSIVGRLRKPFNLNKLEDILTRFKVPATFPHFPLPPVPIEDSELRKAVQDQNFVLHYQPQIDIKTGQVVGMEGLVRWPDPERGLIYPDRFIHRAEELALIDQLGLIVLRLGLEQYSHLVQASCFGCNLSLNVSSLSLRDLRLPDVVSSLLTEYKMPPERLILEVTESAIVEDLSNTLNVMSRLRLKGVQLSIDDFGVGYSMLQQLKRIPATELKIDRSFTQTMLQNYGDRIVVQKTIEIGHELGMRVVAEGVETKAQLEFLGSNGCDIAQGYHFCRPCPAVLVTAWMNEHHSNSGRTTSNGFAAC